MQRPHGTHTHTQRHTHDTHAETSGTGQTQRREGDHDIPGRAALLFLSHLEILLPRARSALVLSRDLERVKDEATSHGVSVTLLEVGAARCQARDGAVTCARTRPHRAPYMEPHTGTPQTHTDTYRHTTPDQREHHARHPSRVIAGPRPDPSTRSGRRCPRAGGSSHGACVVLSDTASRIARLRKTNVGRGGMRSASWPCKDKVTRQKHGPQRFPL